MKNNIPEALRILQLNEMATIGNFDGYKVTVHHENLRNPSFHLWYKNEWQVVIQMKDFSILEKKNSPFEKGSQLPSHIKKSLINFFKQDTYGDINWKVMIINWNGENPEATIDPRYPISECVEDICENCGCQLTIAEIEEGRQPEPYQQDVNGIIEMVLYCTDCYDASCDEI
jgi:hypothetical protein